ncbi:hypothetical protein [Pontibacter mangrovi]|uniref:STAS/SEC14 domain-containing protein n=1 Tax=Pontibacter mangrovi TaxID=2589816 RepID=A0A501W9P1_9BACT|nr:hypothetical protein [Pontibacter mangrovi]TPE46088.1 hypothetical protein FJM65_01710 [Pontibacter mangrovi]
MASLTSPGLDYYKIEVDEQKKLIKSVWLRPVHGHEIIAGATRLYEVLRDTKFERAIADARLITSVSADIKGWLSYDFFELLSSTQLKKLARVIPAQELVRQELVQVAANAQQRGVVRFQVNSFLNPGEALSWLAS